MDFNENLPGFARIYFGPGLREMSLRCPRRRDVLVNDVNRHAAAETISVVVNYRQLLHRTMHFLSPLDQTSIPGARPSPAMQRLIMAQRFR
jgi:hypothetical protein